MNDVWIKFIENAPWAAALILSNYLFLKHIKELDAARSANAANMAKERREHELLVSNMWAVNIKTMIEKQDETFSMIAKALSEHEQKSEERYKRMNITQDILNAVKEKMKGEG